ncbi:conserved hypothetical protein [uncultured delta proteobacterium]|uniref:D-3-phosphoglycerate dehydrogenase n=1 Tax=uncultured delta proteobacterium TaxID=34034 RepID=A0A212K2V1_9DELT|nr:conserved hypothetical protein [uncultured delta proteobacterium]
MMNVFVRAAIHPDAVAKLQADSRVRAVLWDDPAVAAWEEEADAVILRGLDITGEEIRRAKRLKVIGRHGAGVDSVDLEAAKEKGVKVMNTPFENSQSVAELAVGFMLASGRNIHGATTLVREGKWAEGRKGKGCVELFGGTVGLVGYGRIARMVAAILRTAFSMTVRAYDPFVTEEQWAAMAESVAPCKTVEELFASCDYISIHVPKTKETTGLINAAVFAGARKGLVLVNTARGGVIDEAALYEAMKNGTVRAAASDVFGKEPLDPATPLLSLPNFIATPHYGGATEQCLQRVATKIAEETVAALFDEETSAYRYL